ncbi:MAG: tetratricopeptide repeat protein [Dehalococcoidia bacterium]
MDQCELCLIKRTIENKYTDPYPFSVVNQGKGFALVRTADGSTSSSFEEAQQWLADTPGPILIEAASPDPGTDWATIQLDIGHYLFHEGHADLAIDALTRSLELDPENATAYGLRGLLHMQQGEHDQATVDYTNAIAIDGTCGQLYANRALSHYGEGHVNAAMADFERAIQLCPGVVLFYINRGRIYQLMGNWSQAICAYNEAIELDPDDSEIYTYRGESYAGSLEYQKALADFNRAIELDPNNAQARSNRERVIQLLREGSRNN